MTTGAELVGIKPSGIDRSSETWQVIEAWAKARLDSYRNQLEADGVDHGEAEKLRGRIAEMKALCNLQKSGTLKS